MSLRRLFHDRRGAAAVETAVLLPALLLMLLGTMEVGRIAWTKAALVYAVQETARCASVTPAACGTPDQVQAYGAARVAQLGVRASFVVAPVPGCGRQVTGQALHDELLYKFAPGARSISVSVCRA